MRRYLLMLSFFGSRKEVEGCANRMAKDGYGPIRIKPDRLYKIKTFIKKVKNYLTPKEKL